VAGELDERRRRLWAAAEARIRTQPLEAGSRRGKCNREQE